MPSRVRERAVLPSQAALDEVRAAWSRGDFVGCLSVLDALGAIATRSGAWVEATLFRARALYRLKRFAETIALLEPIIATFAQGDEACTARMLLGSSIARAGDARRGLGILEAAAAQAEVHDVHRAVRAEIAHSRALAHWTLREVGDAERLARTAEDADADIISVRARQLRGFVAMAEQRFAEALALFDTTFDAYWRCRERDADLAEMTVHQIAVLEVVLRSRSVRGTHALPDRRRTRDPWETALEVPSVTRLQTYALDAWLFALDGDRTMAFRKMRRAEAAASGPAWRVWMLAGRAALAAAFGEAGSALEFAAHARELSDTVDWDETTGEERVGLLLLTEVLVATDPAVATGTMATYDALPRPMDPDHAVSSDPRLGALEEYVRGLVARVNGDRSRAAGLLATAAQRYASCGHLWRTALALIELHAVVPSGGHLDAARAIVTEHFPNSFLAGRVGIDAVADPIVARLTPAQRDVLALLLDGHNAREIATHSGRAYNTVRVHIDRLREAFHAPSIHAMVVDCHRRGIGLRAPRAPHDKKTVALRNFG